MSNEHVACPTGLSPKGRKAYDAIMAVLKKHELTNTGGCKAFYAPKEWAARGETYGRGSELIVVYDGGDLGYFFNIDRCEVSYNLNEEMRSALEAVGCYSEECTCWFSAIYPV